jgi:putative DNA primase/helicase
MNLEQILPEAVNFSGHAHHGAYHEKTTHAAIGHWPGILTAAGVTPAHLDGKHHACPACGGKDRFRFDDKEGRGTWICNQCGGPDGSGGAGDGIGLLMRVRNTDTKGAYKFVDDYLNINQDKPAKNKPSKPTKAYWQTAQEAAQAFHQLPPAQAHPYLERKGIQAHEARLNGNELIIPVQSDLAGTVVSVQRILPDKNKEGKDKFLAKGPDTKKGNFFLLGRELIEAGGDWCELPARFEGEEPQPARVVLFCEGFATGATLYESTGIPTVVCFDAGNVPAVAEKLRAELGEGVAFLFCTDADDDGAKAARKAIKAARGLGCIPKFEPGQEGKDFNDLAGISGADAVKATVNEELKNTRRHIEFSGKTGFGGDGEKPKFITENGQLKARTQPKTELGVTTEYVYIGAAIEVKAKTRKAHGGGHGRWLEFEVDGKKESWVMPMHLLAGDVTKLMQSLSNLGYRCAGPHLKFIKDSIAGYINSQYPEETYITTEQTGWFGSSFVLTGGESIGNEKVLFVGDDTHIYQPKGKLKDWQAEIGALCVNNSRLEFAVSLSLAGVLMPHTGDDSAGVNFYGETSTGKSTVLFVAGSVWGSPEPGGFVSKWNATSTGLELQAVQRNHTIFCIDELGELDPKVAGKLVYQLSSGVQKGRGKSDINGVGMAELKTWKMPVISSAEKTLAQHVEESGARLYGGQAVRLMDIPADAGWGFGVFQDLHKFGDEKGSAENCGKLFSDALKSAAKAQHGTAGRAFVAALLKHGMPAALADIAAYRAAWEAEHVPENAGTLARRAAKLFSLAAAAGELACKYGVLPWPADCASQGAGHCFNDWLAKNGSGNPEERAALRQIQHFIESRANDFRTDSEPLDGPHARNIPRLAGYLAGADGDPVYYIIPSIFETDACKGFDSGFILRVLEKNHALLRDAGRKTKEIKKPHARRAYGISLSKLLAASA